MKIKYEFVTKETSEVEVSEELYTASIQIDRKIKNNNRRETRRHSSIDKATARHDTEIADNRGDVEADYIEREKIATIRAAIKTLEPEQQNLIRKVFYEGQALKTVAAEMGIKYQSVQDRLDVIKCKLKKYFEDSPV